MGGQQGRSLFFLDLDLAKLHGLSFCDSSASGLNVLGSQVCAATPVSLVLLVGSR